MALAETLSAVASGATAIAVAIAAWQLSLGRHQGKMQFEQQFNDRYRSVIASVPLEALLGEEFDWARESAEVRRAFFDYFELCEEELFFRDAKRINQRTWAEWRYGIENNFSRPAFRVAWADLSERAPNTFTKLDLLLREMDPTLTRRGK